jgi:hypothetical protein
MPASKLPCEGVSEIDIDCAEEQDIEKINTIQAAK